MITQKEYITTILEREGVKYDSDKLRWSLLPIEQVKQVLEVLEFGAKKYAPDNWKKVDNAKERYYNAAMRHLTEHWITGKQDEETNQSHLAHAICCLLFWMWHDDKGKDS